MQIIYECENIFFVFPSVVLWSVIVPDGIDGGKIEQLLAYARIELFSVFRKLTRLLTIL